MRRPLPVLFAPLLLASPLAVAEGGRPIPQDPAKQRQRYEERLGWQRETLAKAYDRVGKRDPRWDEAARESLEAAARINSVEPNPPIPRFEIHDPARRAIEAGCDDPMILYLFYRSSVGAEYPGPEEEEKRMLRAATALERSAYPPFRRAFALALTGRLRANQPELTPESRKETARWFDAALGLLSESAKEDRRGRDLEEVWFEVANFALQGRRDLGDEPRVALERVEAALRKTPDLKPTLLQVRASFLTLFAWEARGSGFADTVTEEGWRKMEARLTEARSALDQAWTLRPGDRRTATLRLNIEIGLGGDREEMEKWFERAMQADGNNATACRLKMDWLDPKWHGSVGDLLEFGRACRATGNWEAGITLLFGNALYRVAQHQPEGEKKRYYRMPENWEALRSAYDEYLGHYPLDKDERARYAAFCYLSGKYAESHEQFRQLGDDPYGTREFPADWLRKIRLQVAERVARPSEAK